MKYTVPDYYNQFQCIASDCPATCCAGWQIVIDDRSLKKYRACKSAFGNRLANSIDWEQKTFLQYDRRCAFLDENQLCDMYTEAGSDMLCRTCRNYPRHIEEFQDEWEISLSVSCPVVAGMLLQRESPVQFVTKENDRTEEEDESFDFFLYSALQDCREVLFAVLQNRQQPIQFRMAKALALVHDVQNRISGGRLFEVQEVLERYQRAGADEALMKRFEPYRSADGNRVRKENLMRLLKKLEVLDPSWSGFLKDSMELLYGREVRDAAKDGGGIAEKPFAEQMMVYFLFTYFCGAVYDGDAFAKMKLAVVCTLLLQELVSLYPEQAESVVWRFSRELEHSDDNLNQMEQMMNEQEAAGFEELLYLILDKAL